MTTNEPTMTKKEARRKVREVIAWWLSSDAENDRAIAEQASRAIFACCRLAGYSDDEIQRLTARELRKAVNEVTA